jgi:branched-chain amino acid aminotransferase
MPEPQNEVSLFSLCSTPEELINSSDFQRVLNLFNREQRKINPDWETVTKNHIEAQGHLAELLMRFWEEQVYPKLINPPHQNRNLNMGEHAKLSDIVDRSFMHIVKTVPDTGYSSDRLDQFRRGARELLNNGYVPVLHGDTTNLYGSPVYPADVEGHHEQIDDQSVLFVRQMPPVRHNGERIEFTNFIKPEDPAKIRTIAEKGELGFTQKERDTSHISFATCLAKKNPNTKEWESVQWSEGVTVPNARFASHPLEQMRQYGSGLFEGIGVERGSNGQVQIFRLRDHWERMSLGGQYFRMPPIPFDIFERMVMDTVRANWDYIPATGKGRLYIRPNWFDIGPKMHVGTSGENVLMMTAVPIGAAQSYYKKPVATTEQEKKDDKGMTIFFPYNVHRSTENGPGQTKADGNYGATVPHIEAAEREGMMGVMYMNEKGTAVEETNASSLVFLQIIPGEKTSAGKQKYKLLTPSLKRGTVLNSITRQTIITLAKQELGWDVVDEDISPDELKKLIESGKITAAFSAGTGAVLTPIHNIQRGNIRIRDTLDENGNWIRTFDIDKDIFIDGPTAGEEEHIHGEHIKIGDYDRNNPYTDAGKELLQVLLDAKSGVLQKRAAKQFLECEIKDPVLLEKLQMRTHTYGDWLTVVEPPRGKDE